MSFFTSLNRDQYIKKACQRAHICQNTFYRWKPRFLEGGYEALSTFESHAPKNPRRTSRSVEQQVIALRKAHPKLGKRSIANESGIMNYEC